MGAVAAEFIVGSDDTMAGNDDRNRADAHGLTNSPGGAGYANLVGNFTVGTDLPIRNLMGLMKNGLLERCVVVNVDRNIVELEAFAGEIGLQAIQDRLGMIRIFDHGAAKLEGFFQTKFFDIGNICLQRDEAGWGDHDDNLPKHGMVDEAISILVRLQ